MPLRSAVAATGALIQVRQGRELLVCWFALFLMQCNAMQCNGITFCLMSCQWIVQKPDLGTRRMTILKSFLDT